MATPIGLQQLHAGGGLHDEDHVLGDGGVGHDHGHDMADHSKLERKEKEIRKTV